MKLRYVSEVVIGFCQACRGDLEGREAIWDKVHGASYYLCIPCAQEKADRINALLLARAMAAEVIGEA